MNLLYQDTYSEFNRLARHLGFKDWDSMPEEKRKEVSQFKGLLKQVEREFHNAILYKRKADYLSQERLVSVFNEMDSLDGMNVLKKRIQYFNQ